MTQRPKRCPTIELDQETLTTYTCQCSQPSFDRWTNLASVQMWDITIIRFLLDEMLEFLNLPFAKDPTSTGDKECRWIMVEFDGCDFGLLDYLEPHDFPESEYCTPDDKLRLFSALSHRALNVFFNESPEILSGLLGVCHRDHFAADTLQIDQSERLSALQYKKLGDMIQRSVQLRELSIRLPLMDGAHELFAGLANAVEIEELSLADAKERNHLRDELGDQLVGGNGDIGPLLQLLQNPQNRLKKLSLSHMGLRDHHLSAILQMIPTSNIEDLDFSGNMIQVQGMLEFANMLPKMNALKRVVFRYNSWQDSPSADDDLDLNKVGAALLQGMMENSSIVSMHGIEHTPQALHLLHYAAMNSAGRRILCPSESIPDGLWPIVLERVGKILSYTSFEALDNTQPISMSAARANSVYYYLQNCPKILSYRVRL